jgi:hypothetical protein
MTNGATTQRHRTYLYYAAIPGVTQHFCYPRIDVMDGSEPSIESMCAGLVDSQLQDFHTETDGTDDIKGIAVRESTLIGTVSEMGHTDGLINLWKFDGDGRDYLGGNDGTVAGVEI